MIMRVCFRPIGHTGPSSISFLFSKLFRLNAVYLLCRTIVDLPHPKRDNTDMSGDVESQCEGRNGLKSSLTSFFVLVLNCTSE